MASYIKIETQRSAYSPDDVGGTMTVGELISFLSDYDEDLPVILSHDNGYTYGGIDASDFDEMDYEDE